MQTPHGMNLTTSIRSNLLRKPVYVHCRNVCVGVWRLAYQIGLRLASESSQHDGSELLFHVLIPVNW